MSLRTQLIKLAHENPEIREDLLPLLKEAGGYGTVRDLITGVISTYEEQVTMALMKLMAKYLDDWRFRKDSKNVFLMSHMTRQGVMWEVWITLKIDWAKNKSELIVRMIPKGKNPGKGKMIKSKDVVDMNHTESAHWILKKVLSHL